MWNLARKGTGPLSLYHVIRPKSKHFNLHLFHVGILALLTLSAGLTCSAQTSVLTYHNDNARTGQNLNETILNPSNVNSTNFGKLGFLAVDGLVDAELLYVSNLMVAGLVRNVVFIATENDSVYAFDADTYAQLWRVTLLGANETASDPRGCTQVTPEIGITSTPVIDLTLGPHGTIFAVAMSKAGSNYYQRLHALDLTTGAEQNGSPTTIQATYPIPDTSNYVTFDPKQYKERAALLLLNGVVYLSWSSHCDDAPYTGWIMGYSESNFQQVGVLNVTPSGSDGAFWMSGGGLAADAEGNIYALDANGTFDNTINSNGFPSQGDFGNAFLKISTSSGLAVSDYFEMYNGISESGQDVDLGSGGLLLLPDLTDNSGNVWHLAVGAGKDTYLYVVNRDSMGKFNSAGNDIYEPMNGVLPGGIYSVPAYFNNTVYFGPVGNPIMAFGISNAMLSTPPASQTGNTFAYPGASPSISANGSSGAILWAVENASPAVLHAYDATKLSTEFYNSNQASNQRDQFGPGNKFMTPMIDNGKVYVGTPTGVAVFGLLNGGTPQVAAPTFSPSSGGITTSQMISISDGTPASTIYYTTNGNTPTAIPSEQYTGPFTLSPPATVEAMAVATGYANSSVATTSYTPLAVSSVSLNPASVVGGNSSTGTVTLNSAAPTGGAVVTLSSGNTAVAKTPGSVTVLAGSTTATFTVTTSAVSTATPVTISGIYNGGTQQNATLTVTPIPVGGSAAFVRSAGGSKDSAAYTVAIAPAAGDFLGVFVWSATTPTITDNKGSAYTQDCAITYVQGDGTRQLTVFHLLNAPSGIKGITSSSQPWSRTIVAEYSGMPTSGTVLDVCGTAKTNTTASTSWSSTAATTTANDLVFGFADTGYTAAAGYKASGAWTGRLEQPDTADVDDSYLEDQLNAAAGSYTATGTTTASVQESTVVVAFKTATGPVAPAITSANNTTFTVGTAGSFTVTTTGSPVASLTESGSLPGLMFTDNHNGTGTLSGTPGAGTAGSYPITFTASNGVGSNAMQSFTLTVDQAPAITSGNSTTFTAGTAGTFTVVATGYPAPTFAESGALPSGVGLSPAGVLSGMPAAGTGGSYPITITASNGVAPNATQSFTLTVNQAVVGAVAFVRSAGGSKDSAAYTVAIAPAAGDFLGVFVWSATTPTITDNKGSAYTQDCAITYVQGDGTRQLTVFHLLNAPSGITGITSSSQPWSRTIVAEYSGMPTSGTVLDVCGTAKTNTTASTSWSSTAATTTANDLVFGFADTGYTAAAGYKVSGAWTGRLEQPDTADVDDSYLEDQLNVAAGSYTATGTTTASVQESTVVVAFKTGN